MKITVLGSGTSTGVPMIGCKCEICQSKDFKNKRFRSSVLITTDSEKVILIDTATDLRMQALNNNIEKVDAVLFTHSHADHVHGLDELRSFNFLQKESIPCYGRKSTINNIKKMFSYIFEDDTQRGGGKPSLEMNIVDSNSFTMLNTYVQPVNIMHGKMEIYGYVLDNFAYVTDCSSIPDGSMKYLKGVDLLILGALGFYKHPTHFSITEAVEAVNIINPVRAVFTHLHHSIDYNKVNTTLPEGIELAYDGMMIEI